MAVGYHKLNSSAARSRAVVNEIARSALDVAQGMMDIPKGAQVNHLVFGCGVVVNGGGYSDFVTVDFDGVEKIIKSTFIKVQKW